MKKYFLSLMITIGFLIPINLNAQFKKGPYIQELSSNSVRILWETSVSSKGRVIYGLKGFIDRSVEEGSSNTFHNVILDGLLPDTEYEYQVEGDNKKGFFRTFPISTKPIKFVVYGDNRTNLLDHQKVVDAIIKEEPMFIINSGDLVESGISADDYQKFFEIERELLRNICIFPAIGNHEIIDPTLTLYKKYLFPPQKNSNKKEWYSFDIANIHIAVYNTYDGLFTISNEQLKWIEADLSTASRNPMINHIFTVMHHGPYSASNHGDNSIVKSKIVPLLKKYGVDMTFAGHDHNYERGEADGLRYIVTGGGGAPLYSAGTSRYTIYSESVLHYVVINVFGPDVSGCAYRVDGTTMDCFNWTKEGYILDGGYEDISDNDSVSADIEKDSKDSYDTIIVDSFFDAYYDLISTDEVLLYDEVDTDDVVNRDSLSDIDNLDTNVQDIRDIVDARVITDITIVRPDSLITQSESTGCNCTFVE